MSNKQREVRVFAAPQRFEIRKASDGSTVIGGNAIVYGAESLDLGGFTEKIAAGAFSASLRNDDQLCLYSHDDSRILGRKSSGTLTLSDSSTALSFRCILPNTQDGQTVGELCRRGDLKGVSWGMIVTDDDWSNDSQGRVIRTVNTAELIEVSPTGMPAYEQTTVSLRSCPAALRSKLAVRSTPTEPTKEVDGVALPRSSFAYAPAGSPPSEWKFPIFFPGDPEKSADHARLALALWSTQKGIPDSAKAEVYAKIVGAAKAHGIAVSHESLRDREDADDWTDPDPYADDDTDPEDALTGAYQGSFDADATDEDGDDEEEDSLRRDRLRVATYFANAQANLT